MDLNKSLQMVFFMLLSLIIFQFIPNTAPAATFIVDSFGDDSDFDTSDGVCNTKEATTKASVSECTLRAAIEQANATAGEDTILFSIVAGIGISPQRELPTVTDLVIIDGGTQPDGSDVGVGRFLDGSDAGTNANGLHISARSTIKGMHIARF